MGVLPSIEYRYVIVKHNTVNTKANHKHDRNRTIAHQTHSENKTNSKQAHNKNMTKEDFQDDDIVKNLQTLGKNAQRSKIRRLAPYLPYIEQLLKEGVGHKPIIEVLNQSGFGLNQKSYETMLARLRTEKKKWDEREKQLRGSSLKPDMEKGNPEHSPNGTGGNFQKNILDWDPHRPVDHLWKRPQKKDDS